jgi:hypothetical protein
VCCVIAFDPLPKVDVFHLLLYSFAAFGHRRFDICLFTDISKRAVGRPKRTARFAVLGNAGKTLHCAD